MLEERSLFAALKDSGATMNPLELRRAIGWSFVYFFLRLTGRAWEDLSPEERHACWMASADVSGDGRALGLVDEEAD